jgi:hypothetical protein
MVQASLSIRMAKAGLSLYTSLRSKSRTLSFLFSYSNTGRAGALLFGLPALLFIRTREPMNLPFPTESKRLKKDVLHGD